MRRAVAAFALVVFAAACSSGGSSGDSSKVTASEFGDEWPLTVDSATLACHGSDGVGAATATVDGTEYALNGTAKSDYADIMPIWKDDPELGAGLKVSIGPLIDRALELC